VHPEYLLWWADGMDIPALATAGPTGRLDDPTTTILFGNDAILDDSRSGFRLRAGAWLDRSRCVGLEGEYWFLGRESTSFVAASDAAGNPSLFRPFFNMNPRDALDNFDPPPREDVELVSTPDVLSGSVTVDAFSELGGAGVGVRWNLCCNVGCGRCRDACGNVQCVRTSSRLDWLLGYRHVRLREGLAIREDLTSLLPAPDQGDFDILDSFETSNSFNGVDLGVVWQGSWGPWSLDLLGKLALGNVSQEVVIQGQTVISNSENDDGTYTGGLLAQRTNIGTYRREQFGIVPELGVTLGLRIAPRMRATLGYSFLYLSRVARPGEQIDLDVNPDLLPPEFDPFAGPDRPAFVFRDVAYWAQGLNVGLHLTW
jgi:hypothetical protein